MSLAENTLTVSRYKGWKHLPKPVVIDYATTVYKESNRIPDRWSFSIKENGLYDEKRDGYVRDIVKEFPHPNLYLRRTEDAIIEQMDAWSLSPEEDFFVWVSPVFAGEYPCNKIEILHKRPDADKTDNIAINFDCSADTCLEVAKKIFPQLSVVKSTEELRKSIVITRNLDIDKIIESLDPFISKPDKTKVVDVEHFEYIADLAQKGVGQKHIALEMERLGLIGEKSFSCPGTSLGLNGILEGSSLSLNSSEDQYGSLRFTCPKCGVTNTRPYGHLLTNCQHCGGDVRC